MALLRERGISMHGHGECAFVQLLFGARWGTFLDFRVYICVGVVVGCAVQERSDEAVGYLVGLLVYLA